MEYYTTGTGQKIRVHDKDKCAGEYCAIHNPSDNILSSFPTHWRGDRGIMERICPGNTGHPDIDDFNFRVNVLGENPKYAGIHGCCSICLNGYCEQCGIYPEQSHDEEFLG